MGSRRMDERFDQGMKVRREVLGDAHVDKVLGQTSALGQPLQKLVTEYCWGSVWTRDVIPRGTRSLLTIAMLTAQRHHEELASHVRAALRNGCSPEEIAEVVIHAAIYCGVPTSLSAMRVVQRTLEEAGTASAPLAAGGEPAT